MIILLKETERAPIKWVTEEDASKQATFEQRLRLGRVAAAGEQVWGSRGRSEPGALEELKALPVFEFYVNQIT